MITFYIEYKADDIEISESTPNLFEATTHAQFLAIQLQIPVQVRICIEHNNLLTTNIKEYPFTINSTIQQTPESQH